jgi:prephenate dehydrogenase
MEDGFRLQDARIAVIGLGLMGSSLALALKEKCAALFGIDTDQTTLQLAIDKQIVDQADSDPVKLLRQTDLVILATPIPAIMDWIRELPALIQTSCIVLDLGSTKKDIVQFMSTLPELFDPIGGHPICGKEKLGLENADGNLYRGVPFVITPLERTTRRAKSAVAQIISVIGANMIEMTAEAHDQILASTSHLPFIISSALAHATPEEFASLTGPGFRSTSRLAGTPSSMMMGVLKSNRDHILKAIQDFHGSLHEMEAALQDENYAELELILTQSRTSYLTLIHN